MREPSWFTVGSNASWVPSAPVTPSRRLTSTVSRDARRRAYTSNRWFVSAGSSAAPVANATTRPSPLIDALDAWAAAPAEPGARLAAEVAFAATSRTKRVLPAVGGRRVEVARRAEERDPVPVGGDLRPGGVGVRAAAVGCDGHEDHLPAHAVLAVDVLEPIVVGAGEAVRRRHERDEAAVGGHGAPATGIAAVAGAVSGSVNPLGWSRTIEAPGGDAWARPGARRAQASSAPAAGASDFIPRRCGSGVAAPLARRCGGT